MFSRQSTQATLRIARPRTVQQAARRFQTTQAGSQPANSSHLVSGLAGGGLVLGAIYGYYHWSGTAKVVNTSRQAIDQATKAKNQLLSATPSASDAISLLRSFAKSYAAVIPGAAGAVDASFDQLEKLAEKHGDKVAEVVTKTYNDIVKAASEGKDGSEKIIKALQEAAEKVKALVEEEGGKAWEALGDKYPDLKKSLGGQAEELQKLADKHGPEASKIATDFYNEASEIATKGGINGKTLDSIRKLLTDKTAEVKSLGEKAGKDAWEASSKAAAPLLQKLPDVQKLVDENVGKLEGVVGEDKVNALKELYSEIAKIGQSDKSVEDKAKEVKKLVESKSGSFADLAKKATEAGSKAGDSAKKYAESIPGLGELSKLFDVEELKHLKELAEKHGDKAGDILKSTQEEIKAILKKKVEEAKKVGGEAKEDAKKEAKK